MKKKLLGPIGLEPITPRYERDIITNLTMGFVFAIIKKTRAGRWSNPQYMLWRHMLYHLTTHHQNVFFF